MKRIALALAVLLLVSPCWAAQVSREVIAATALTKGDSEATATVYTGDTNNLVFFVDYVPLNNETLAVTLDVSYNGTDWMDANFYDYTSGLAITTTEALTTDAWYYLYWENRLSVPYVRIHTIGTTWAAASSATVTVYSVERK